MHKVWNHCSWVQHDERFKTLWNGELFTNICVPTVYKAQLSSVLKQIQYLVSWGKRLTFKIYGVRPKVYIQINYMNDICEKKTQGSSKYWISQNTSHASLDLRNSWFFGKYIPSFLWIYFLCNNIYWRNHCLALSHQKHDKSQPVGIFIKACAEPTLSTSDLIVCFEIYFGTGWTSWCG